MMTAGGAGLAIGTIVYFSAGPKEGSASGYAEALSPPTDAARARAWIGLGEVGLSGEF
jgi:hypothetical protein